MKQKGIVFLVIIFFQIDSLLSAEFFSSKISAQIQSSYPFLNLFSVRKNQKKTKPSPKDEQEIEGLHEKLDFLDNIIEQIEKEIQQIEKQHEPNTETQEPKKEETSPKNPNP